MIVDRREFDRRARQGRSVATPSAEDQAQRRVVRDRRRARVPGDLPPLARATAHRPDTQDDEGGRARRRWRPRQSRPGGGRLRAQLAGRRAARRARAAARTATNNVAEYRALLLGLQQARELGASEVEVVGDSELIAKQVLGEYKVKNEALRPLHREATEALRAFDRFGRFGPCRARRTRTPTRSSTPRWTRRAPRSGSLAGGGGCEARRRLRSVQRPGRAGDREHLFVWRGPRAACW